MEIYYINSAGQRINFTGRPYRMLSETDLFDYEWEYNTKRNNRVKNIKKTSRTAQISIVVNGKDTNEYYENIAKLYEILDYDCVMGEPGKLYCGRYFLQCYFYKGEKIKKYANVKQTTVIFTIVTDLVNWVKETITSYRNRQVAGTDVNGIDYKHDYPYDFKSVFQTVNNTSFYPSDFIMTIYGPCQEPMITIGDNIYLVHTDLEKGDYLLIDSRNRKVTKVKNDGTRVNEFAKRSRDYYVFEKIKQGINPVSWEGNYDFDVSILDERGEPKWT